MGNINMSPSEDGPEVNYDSENHIFKISGNSYPENCEVIYQPILNFIENYDTQKNSNLELHFHFNLINSTSTVYIAQVMQRVGVLAKGGLPVTIKWFYDRFDEDLLDLGEKLSAIASLPIECIPVDDND